MFPTPSGNKEQGGMIESVSCIVRLTPDSPCFLLLLATGNGRSERFCPVIYVIYVIYVNAAASVPGVSVSVVRVLQLDQHQASEVAGADMRGRIEWRTYPRGRRRRWRINTSSAGVSSPGRPCPAEAPGPVPHTRHRRWPTRRGEKKKQRVNP